MSKTRNEYKISAYLRLAELCSPSETEKKQYYMEMVEQLLQEDMTTSIPHQLLNELDKQVIEFVKDVSLESCLEKATGLVFNEFLQWQNEHGYPNKYNNLQFGWSFAKTQPIKCMFSKDENRKTIRIFRKV